MLNKQACLFLTVIVQMFLRLPRQEFSGETKHLCKKKTSNVKEDCYWLGIIKASWNFSADWHKDGEEVSQAYFERLYLFWKKVDVFRPHIRTIMKYDCECVEECWKTVFREKLAPKCMRLLQSLRGNLEENFFKKWKTQTNNAYCHLFKLYSFPMENHTQ